MWVKLWITVDLTRRMPYAASMFRTGLSLATLLALAAPASAAPWARDPGAAFLSYSLSADSTQDQIADFDGTLYHSFYGEVGLGRRLTLGFALGGDDETQEGNGFLRYTFTRAASQWQLAADIGLGFREVDGTGTTDLYRVGGSIGRGFGADALDWIPYLTPQGGWMSLDTVAMIDPDATNGFWQAELTLGLELSDRFGAMMQLQAEEYPEADLAIFASPNLLWYLGEDTTAQFGGRFGVEGSEEIGIRAGIWQEF